MRVSTLLNTVRKDITRLCEQGDGVWSVAEGELVARDQGMWLERGCDESFHDAVCVVAAWQILLTM